MCVSVSVKILVYPEKVLKLLLEYVSGAWFLYNLFYLTVFTLNLQLLVTLAGLLYHFFIIFFPTLHRKCFFVATFLKQ